MEILFWISQALLLISLCVILFTDSERLFIVALIVFISSLLTLACIGGELHNRQTVRIDSSSFNKSVTNGNTVYVSHDKRLTVIIEGEKK